METVRDFIFLGSKTTADGNCNHEIKRHLLLGRKAMTKLDSILKNRDITFLSSWNSFRTIKMKWVSNYSYKTFPTMRSESESVSCSVMSDSVQPQRQQPTSLPCPWDSPGKNTGVGWHFLLQCMKVKSESEVAQSRPTLSGPMDCSLPGSSVHGISQARVLELGAIAFSVPIMDIQVYIQETLSQPI